MAPSGELGEIALPVSDTADAHGTLRVESGAGVICDSLYLAYNGGANTTANVVVDGDDSYLGITNDLNIGNGASGTASVTVANGGSLYARNIYLDGSGSTLICDADSAWDLAYSFSASKNAKAEFHNRYFEILPYSFVVSSGADVIMTEGVLLVGAGTEIAGSLLIDGSDSTFSGDATGVVFGVYGGNANGVFGNGARASFYDVHVAGFDSYSGDSNNTASVRVESGATVTSGDLFVAAAENTGNNGSLTITGNGSRWDTNTLYVGFDSTNIGAVNLLDHGTLNVGQTFIRSGGKIVVNGGSFSAGEIAVGGIVGGGLFDFQSGALSLAGTALIGYQGLMHLALDGEDTVNLGAATYVWIDSGGALELAGTKAALSDGVDTADIITVADAALIVSGTNQVAGDVSGGGDAVLLAGADFTVDSLEQNSLTLEAGSVLTIRPLDSGPLPTGLSGSENLLDVPEPATVLLLILTGILLPIWRRLT